jgi:hypothetical protein
MFGGHVDVHLVWELSEARPLRRNLLNNMYDGRKHEQAKATYPYTKQVKASSGRLDST